MTAWLSMLNMTSMSQVWSCLLRATSKKTLLTCRLVLLILKAAPPSELRLCADSARGGRAGKVCLHQSAVVTENIWGVSTGQEVMLSAHNVCRLTQASHYRGKVHVSLFLVAKINPLH